MSEFFFEDLVAFRDDRSIVGTIDCTWSDTEISSEATVTDLYYHKSLPSASRKAFLHHDRLPPGFVVIEFAQAHDGFCLVAEKDLVLLDRALTVGDIVKHSPSDIQSGTVVSTSIDCTLEPTCSKEEYSTNRYLAPIAHPPAHGAVSPWSRAGGQAPLVAPARELTFWNDYREEDFIIFQDWIGVVRYVTDEVAIRLSNGSVVVVESTEDLSEPYYVPGSPSYCLAQRLHDKGYIQRSFSRERRQNDTPSSMPIEACYPGQCVQTKKGNLRRGRWKYGAYDPNVSPQGVVVEVRVIELEVEWLSPNILNERPASEHSPPTILDIDVLQTGQVTVFDRNRLPKEPKTATLLQATYAPDTAFGTRVRFRDLGGAAVKYGENFERIPRIETQGFDMNVLHVISTLTKVLVRWQDGSVSEHDSTSLSRSHNLDEHEIWPGDKVSYKPNEILLEDQTSPILRTTHVGVVQTVNAAERMAKVRWFDGAKMDIGASAKDWYTASSTYGRIGDRMSDVSIYDLSTYPAFDPLLGDLAIALSDLPGSFRGFHALEYHFGEVVELCLDGSVILRCGPSGDPKDLKKAVSGLAVIASGTMEFDAEDEAGDMDVEDEQSDMSDEVESTSDRTETTSPEPIEVEIEYEGGEKAGDDDDGEDAWSTDDEDDDTKDEQQGEDLNPVHVSETPPADSKVPLSFEILESVPQEHHFLFHPGTLGPENMRRIIKEHKILETSLPEGVYVRAWEGRIDLLRVLIIGPAGTPYEFAPFMIDMRFSGTFPESPPETYFHSWTNHAGRINPNLYEDGKICLSLLGTWHADRKNESWSPKKSTVLQIIVSILGLVLVKEPYYSKYQPTCPHPCPPSAWARS